MPNMVRISVHIDVNIRTALRTVMRVTELSEAEVVRRCLALGLPHFITQENYKMGENARSKALEKRDAINDLLTLSAVERIKILEDAIAFKVKEGRGYPVGDEETDFVERISDQLGKEEFLERVMPDEDIMELDKHDSARFLAILGRVDEWRREIRDSALE